MQQIRFRITKHHVLVLLNHKVSNKSIKGDGGLYWKLQIPTQKSGVTFHFYPERLFLGGIVNNISLSFWLNRSPSISASSLFWGFHFQDFFSTEPFFWTIPKILKPNKRTLHRQDLNLGLKDIMRIMSNFQ